MTRLRKILFAIAAILAVLVLLNYSLRAYITKRLPMIIHNQKDFPYNVSYDGLDINLFSGSLAVHNAYIAPKDTLSKPVRTGIYSKIRTIRVQNLNLWALLRDDRIKVRRIVIEEPDVILYDRGKKYSVENDVKKPFRNTITTGSLEIVRGRLQLLDPAQQVTLKAGNINVEVNDIKADSATVEKNIPIKYSDYLFSCDSLFYKLDKFYNVTASRITNSDSSMTINNFKLIPKFSRVAFTKAMKLEKDLFTLRAKQINIPAAEWGFAGEQLYVHSPRVTMDNVYANIYRNKIPTDDPKPKKMYSELLRDIDFDLKIEKLLLRNSLIEYEEQVDFTRPAAKVTFSKFYATVHKMYSKANRKKLPNTVIDAQCLFMKTSPLKVNWSFNTLNQAESFNINGIMQNIDSDKIDPVSQPLLNVKTTGTLKKVKFNINGNENHGTGTFAINYDDLKVEVLNKEGKKRKLLSGLANVVIKNDTNEKLKQTEIDVKRAKDKSFFNFLWLCLQDGLRKAVLPKAVEKLLPEVKPPKPKKK